MHCEPVIKSLDKAVPVVSVVMPCLNEERTVGLCVQAALASLARLGIPGEVLVSDNGSTDRSVDIACEAGARVVHCHHLGYGHAVRFGVEQSGGQFVVMGDADGSYDFESIGPFVGRLQDGAHLVMGNRFQGGIRPGAMPWKNRYIGNPALTWLLNALFGTRIGDAHCGLRGFTRGAFERMRLESAGMELASEMVLKAARIGLTVQEVPTVLSPDGRGRRPHLRPWRDGWRHVKLLLMFSPLHLFLLPAVMLLLAGLL
ncbi:MAG: glycosyltransferase family 2 protein, partial [Pirellulales bacterium]